MVVASVVVVAAVVDESVVVASAVVVAAVVDASVVVVLVVVASAVVVAAVVDEPLVVASVVVASAGNVAAVVDAFPKDGLSNVQFTFMAKSQYIPLNSNPSGQVTVSTRSPFTQNT